MILAPFERIQGMPKIIPFDSIDEMFEQIAHDRDTADGRVEPWQAEMKVGDHFVRIVEAGSLVVIYGEILETASEYEEDREHYEQPHMKHFRFTRCFSVMCPDGELGDTHVSVMHKLSPTQFELARQMGWPSDSRLRGIVELS